MSTDERTVSEDGQRFACSREHACGVAGPSADEVKKVKARMAKWRPGKIYARVAASIASAAFLAWTATIAAIFGSDGPRVGKLVAALLAASASLLLCVAYTAGQAWSDYRAHRRAADRYKLQLRDDELRRQHEDHRYAEILKVLNMLRGVQDDEQAAEFLQAASDSLAGFPRAVGGSSARARVLSMNRRTE